MTLRGMFAYENGVRLLEVFAAQETVERGERDRPEPARALNEGGATGVLADCTPRECRGLVCGSLGDKTAGVATRAIDLSDLFTAGAVGVGGLPIPPGLPLGRNRKSALRTCRGAVGDTLCTLGAVNEHGEV